MIRIAVLISGRGSNLQALLDACRDGRIDGEIAVVLSDHADAYGLERARMAGVERLFVEPTGFPRRADYFAAVTRQLQERRIDLLCLAGYMRIVRSPLLEAFAGRILNIHPSLLPAFPGLDAQRQALATGVKVAGCTVHFVTAGMDEGPIVMQATVPVHEDDTVASLTERILAEEHRIYPAAVQLFAQEKLRIDGRRVIVG